MVMAFFNTITLSLCLVVTAVSKSLKCDLFASKLFKSFLISLKKSLFNFRNAQKINESLKKLQTI